MVLVFLAPREHHFVVDLEASLKAFCHSLCHVQTIKNSLHILVKISFLSIIQYNNHVSDIMQADFFQALH